MEDILHSEVGGLGLFKDTQDKGGAFEARVQCRGRF